MAKHTYPHYNVNAIFNQLAREAMRQSLHCLTTWDPISCSVVWLVANETAAQKSQSIKMSSYTIAKILHSTRQRVRTRLQKLSKFGLVKVESNWRNDGSNKRQPMTIQLNPLLLHLFETGVKPSTKKTAVKHFITLGISRLEVDETLQGFDTDCKFGEEEPLPSGPPESVDDKLNKLVETDDFERAEKLRLATLWREYDESFINSAANLWVYAQSKTGRGTARPNWEGPTKDLAPGALKERRELTKTFRQYGCKTTSLAWYIFTCGVPALDKNNRPEFDLSMPHRQFATTDKKPSQFTKHFNSILRDSHFNRFARKDWGSIEHALSTYFGDLMEIEPMDGETTSDKLGYGIGTDTITLGDLNATT